jgi:hypothetical protein
MGCGASRAGYVLSTNVFAEKIAPRAKEDGHF